MGKNNKSLLVKEFNKELRRIKRFIKSAEKRGFIFELSEHALSRPKRITEKSVNKLKKLTPELLYKKSYAYTDSGERISGKYKRTLERSASARKAAETVRQKRYSRFLKDLYSDIELKNKINEAEKFQEDRKRKDKEAKEKFNRDKEFRERFSQGSLIYNSIKSMIQSVGREHKKAAEHLNSILEGEIKKYGASLVMTNISYAPDEMIEAAQLALRYNPGDSRHDDSIRTILTLITGTIPTAEELKELQEVIDSDGESWEEV